MNKGEILWQKANGLGSPAVRNHPLLKGLEIPPLGNGVDILLVTKTLLICGQVSPGEDGEAMLVARDKRTGDVVGAVSLPGRAIGGPMTYMVGDKQYLALTLQGTPPELVALSLPRAGAPEE